MRIKYSFIIVVFLIKSLLTFAQPKDTLVMNVVPGAGDQTAKVQRLLGTKTNKFLKLKFQKGLYNFAGNLRSESENTMIECVPGAVFRFSSEINSGILVTHSNFTISGATIKGNGKSAKDYYTGYGVLLNGASNCVIKNCTFENISGNNIFFYPSGDTKGCSNNLIKNNIFRNPAFDLGKNGDEAAIMLGYSGEGYQHNNNVIQDNDIDGGFRIKIGIGIIGHGRHNIIQNNTVSNCRNYGILAYESQYFDTTLSNTFIEGNTVRNIGEYFPNKTVKGMGIYLMQSNNSTVRKNRIFNTLLNSDQTETLGAGAISVSGSPNSIIEENFIDGSFMYGITSDYSFGSKFQKNTVQNIRKSGAYFINMSNALVEGNTFKNIGEVVLKGYFEHTSLPYIQAQLVTDRFKNRPTGNNFIIRNNTFYTDGDVLFFSGTKKNNGNITADNFIGNNTFYNNDIISSRRKFREVVHFRNEKKNSNFIKYNTF